MDTEAANRDPRDQITYVKKDWVCPCTGCKKARKQALKQVQDILFSEKDIMYTWSMAHDFIREELKK